ncbi:MAG: YheT family hydrolase [Cyanobacteriota bacterium]|jgi:predicted alpha/beta-fold hydrolase
MNFRPPWYLRNGFLMTLHTAWGAPSAAWKLLRSQEPVYQEHIFTGAGGVPLYGRYALPPNPRGTWVMTYGITGDLDNQWFLRLWAKRAYERGYGVLIFDWRGHGKTAELSPTLTSDGLYEGEDFCRLAAQAKALGFPAPFWFGGYSLGGQLALWGIAKGQSLAEWAPSLGLTPAEIAGGAVICPSLESERSLRYLMAHPLGRYFEKAIAANLKQLALRLYQCHPGAFDLEIIQQADSIWAFDEGLVIKPLGFKTVSEYYQASSALPLLPRLKKPTYLLYAEDDRLFDPSLIPELRAIAQDNPFLDLCLTPRGGHVGYYNSLQGQRWAQDPDPWWAIHRALDWVEAQSPNLTFSEITLAQR